MREQAPQLDRGHAPGGAFLDVNNAAASARTVAKSFERGAAACRIVGGVQPSKMETAVQTVTCDLSSSSAQDKPGYEYRVLARRDARWSWS
jgi:hypothetical protein